MRNFKKILALLLSITMVLGLGVAAFALDGYSEASEYVAGTTYYDGEGNEVAIANAEAFAAYTGTLYTKNEETPAASTVKIEIERDTTYDGTGDGNTYTWYKVFSASYESNTATVGGHDANGNPLATENTAEHVAYTATSEVAAKLGTWDATAKTWTKASGNLWFKLTPIAGTTNYSVEWDNTNTDSATAQAAAKWLYDNQVWEDTGSLTFADGKFAATGLDKGYYLINGVTGKNLVAATTDITIKEKNEYPSDDKKQADEDNTTMTDDDKNVAIGDVIDYEVTVHIPATAKVGDLIVVWDKASTGLTYNNDVEVKTNTGAATVTPGTKGSNYSDDGADSTATWNQLITVTAGSQNKDVVFKFSMTVNSDAVVDTDKKNESGLKFGNTDGSGNKTFPYESTPDKVEYKTYYAGIHKIDGDTDADLEGVEFELKEAGSAFNVTKHADGYYYYDASSTSNKVVTDSNGLIAIRGLDSDKTYTLTETKTLDGYNMLDSDVTLTPVEDTTGSVTWTPVDTNTVTAPESGVTYYTKNGNDYVEATGITEWAAETTYYTRTESTSESAYSKDAANKSSSTWGVVENNNGTVLPSTGGIGTTIFYIVGGLLAVGAGVVLVSKKRMGKEDL